MQMQYNYFILEKDECGIGLANADDELFTTFGANP